jgi:hypothetical protein
MIVSGDTPDPAYLHYSFLRPFRQPVHFYFAGTAKHRVRLTQANEPLVTWARMIEPCSGQEAFLISLGGFATIVSTMPIDRCGESFMDRIAVLEQPTPLGWFRIIFDWSGEPT